MNLKFPIYIKPLYGVLTALVLTGCKNRPAEADMPVYDKPVIAWETLFDGNNLDQWTPKIKGQEPGVDTLNTFVARDGMISVDYSKYGTFNNRFGHLFYKKPYTAYYLSLEYRFKEEQLPDGEGWAYKNSGVMFHAQPPGSMLRDQNFPVCLEGQFLGGNGNDERPTMNLCTPGTHVRMADTLFTPHCVNSVSPTFHDSQWVEAGFLVLSDSLIVHYVNGKEVLRYTKPVLGGDMAADATAEFQTEGTPLTSGYIALQSESHPIEFRNILIADLEPYYGDQKKLEAVIKGIREERNR